LIGVALTLAVVGLLFIALFTLDLGHVASRLAHWHSENNRKYPRFYAVTDPLAVARRPVYWRFYGAVFGAIWLIIAVMLFLTSRS